MNRFLFGCVLLAVSGLLPATSLAADTGISVASEDFLSGNKTIREDCYRPFAPGIYPVAVVLHGAGGTLFDGPEMRRVAKRLAESGMEARVIHYFDGSGVAFTIRDAVLRAHHDEWLQVVRDAITFASGKKNPGGRATRVVVYGYSMGAFLGVEASSNNPLVSALTEQAGGNWDNQTDRVGRMPPVLMIHGREDRRVPFNQYAVPLGKLLKQRGTIPETLFVEGEGHSFSSSAQAKAREAVVDFLRRHLCGSKPVTTAKKPGRHHAGKTIQG